MPALVLTRDAVEGAFQELGARARAGGMLVEIAVYGGVAMMLTFAARPATKDVDAVARTDAAVLRTLARELAVSRNWPENWLNDAVKGFLSADDRNPEATTLFRTYPSEKEPGLRVYVASPEYLLAMKCLAMRIGDPHGSEDLADIERLLKLLGLATSEAVLDIVAKYYPKERIPPKTRFGVEEIMERLHGAAGKNNA
jgi:hypothetical protein